MEMKSKHGYSIIIIAVSVTILLLVNPLKYSMHGFITGYQGIQFEFNSVYFKGYWYDFDSRGPNPAYTPPIGSSNPWGDHPGWEASANEFLGDRVNLDPDDGTTFLPNLCASQQPVAVDTDYGTQTYGPWRIKVDEETNSYENSTHKWTETTEVYKEYQITRYRAVWSCNVWLVGDYNEASPSVAHVWRDAQLWIRINPQSFAYFKDNPDEVYFAPAKMQVENLDWYSVSGQEETKTSEIANYQDLIPEARGDVLGVYYSKGSQQMDLEEKVLSYQGAELDPTVFRDEYYVCLSILHYQPVSTWNDWLHITGWSYRFPSVKIDFEIFVFMVGEWTVMLTEDEVIKLETHEPELVDTRIVRPETWDDWLVGLAAWFEGITSWIENISWLDKTAVFLIVSSVIFLAVLVVLAKTGILSSMSKAINRGSKSKSRQKSKSRGKRK